MYQTPIGAIVAYAPPALQWPATLCIVLSVGTWVNSLLTGNVSQVDRLWSVLPAVYAVYFALMPFLPSDDPLPKIARLFVLPYTPLAVPLSVRIYYSSKGLLMALLIALWTLRLTYNAWRRGILKPNEEDYRWELLRQKMSRVLFQLFNLVFISCIQNVVLLSLAYPVYLVVVYLPPDPLTSTDYTLFVIGLVILLIEFTADNQQHSYQSFKRIVLRNAPSTGEEDEQAARAAKVLMPKSSKWPFSGMPYTAADARRGFVTTGLWAYSRHPNFLCEQSFWVLIGLFPALSLPLRQCSSSAVEWLVASFAPALGLIGLFAGSTWFTESVTRSKYPAAYEAYQKRVGMLLPLPWGWVMNEQERNRCDRLVWGHKSKST